MPRAVKQAKISDIILAQLEEMILSGELKSGEKLSSERDLAAQFEVSRPSLREAIQKLETKGLVVRKQGGGTFVTTNMLSTLSDPLFDLMTKNPESQLDLLEFRLGLEGMAAYYAAIRASQEDLQVIQSQYEAIELAQIENDVQQEAKAVFEFLLVICQASQNAVFVHLVRSMASVLVEHIAKSLSVLAKQPEVFDKIRSYRKRLTNAILNGKAQKAWSESHSHLTYIGEVLLQQPEIQQSLLRSMRPMRRF